jgi:hypothetical protein
VPAIGIRAELLRQTRNILTEFVQEFPLASEPPLDYRPWQLICGREWSQSGGSYLWGTVGGCANHKSRKVCPTNLSGCTERMAAMAAM